MKKLDEKTKRIVLGFQKNEITEHHIYNELARMEKKRNNKKVLKKISEDEHRHYNIWKSFTRQEVKPNMFKVWQPPVS